jgi:uncharacterized phage protein (TIGR01671 family)
MKTMRQIKFRAWDKKIKKMYEDIPLISLSSHVKEKDETLNKSLKSFQTDSVGFTLMQFTGLLDKNGKEIYEGDVLKWTHPNFTENKVEYKILEMSDIRKSLMIEPDCLNGWIEIIGNIYEN